MNTIIQRILKHISLTIFIIIDLIIFLLLFYFFIFEANFHLLSITLSSINLITGILIISGIINTIFILFYYRTLILFPIKQLKQAQEVLIEKDLKELSMAISEFSIGNLAVKIPDNSRQKYKFIRVKELVTLIKQYEKIFNQAREIIQDFNSVTSVPCQRICYVGADSFMEGEKCGEIMGSILKGRGEVAILVHTFSNTGHYLRKKGFLKVINNKYPNITVVDVLEEYESYEKAYACTKELVEKWPDLKGIYVTEGSTPPAVAKAIVDSNRANKIKIVAHDVTQGTIKYLKESVISATLSQNPYAQGYDPVIHLYNSLISPQKTIISRYLTKLELITLDNYREHWDPLQRQLLSEEARQALAKPLENENNTLYKMAIILPDDTKFWEPVAKGARDVMNLLKQYNVRIDIHIPENIRMGDCSAKAFTTAIQSIIKEEYQGLCLPIFDRDLIPYLNELAFSGMCLATYNAEPVSFRGMFNTILQNTHQLFYFSEIMADSSLKSSEKTTQISHTMKLIRSRTVNQLQQLKQTEDQLQVLLNHVNTIEDKSTESLNSAKNTKQTADIGYQAVLDSNQAVTEAQKITKIATDTIKELNEKAKQIQEIISLINNIASKTDFIAINTSVLAARAGVHGKGFSIIANEIKELAEQSILKSKDVTQIIDTILTSVKAATEMILKGMDSINKSTQLSRKVETVFNEIKLSSSINKDKMETITEAINEMKTISQNLKEYMNTLAEINHNNSSTIEDITNSTLDVSQKVVENSDSARKLASMAQTQEDVLNQFFIDEESK